MKIENLTEVQAKGFYRYNDGKTWFIYRRLNNGSYKKVGSIQWRINYGAIPIKQKHWPLMFFSSSDHGDNVIPAHPKPIRLSK